MQASTPVNLLLLKNVPIFEQLQLEEALLRANDENWCLINEGSPPAIVMGISGKTEELVHAETWRAKPIPLIKRFSGGGTVVVDESTLFASFIFQKKAHPFPAYPEPILKWTADFYRDAFQLPDFSLRENDYILGNLKCGGNAQYIKRERWLHHTTFLWDYEPAKMDYLLMPKKTPKYRAGRSHLEFICALKEHFASLQDLSKIIQDTLSKKFHVKLVEFEDAKKHLQLDHRRATKKTTC